MIYWIADIVLSIAYIAIVMIVLQFIWFAVGALVDLVIVFLLEVDDEK